jgi:hypothetical protein
MVKKDARARAGRRAASAKSVAFANANDRRWPGSRARARREGDQRRKNGAEGNGGGRLEALVESYTHTRVADQSTPP